MNRMLKYGLIALTAVLGVGSAAGDAISLLDGDRLSGSLIEVSDDIVVFRTELAGKMMLPVSQVVSLVTTRDVQCVFKDGSRATGRLVHSPDGMRFVPSNGDTAYSVTPTMLATVAPLPPGATPDAQPVSSNVMTSSIQSGVQYRAGSDDYLAPYARLRLRDEADRYYFLLDTYLETLDQGGFPSAGRSYAEWSLRGDTLLRPRIALGLERDTSQTLDLRGTLGIGGYHSLWQSANQDLTASLTLVGEAEQWDADHLPDLDVFPGSGVDALKAAFYYRTVDTHREETDLRLNLGFRHLLRLFKSGSFEEQLSITPSLTDGDDWRGAYESSFLFPLTDRLRLNLNLRIDYDSEPAFRYLEEWRTAVGAGIEWNF